MKHNYSGKYQNVEIRQLQKGDLEFLRKWRNDPANTEFLRKIPHITKEMQEKWFEAYLEDEGEMTFAICENEAVNGIVGSMSLYNFEDKRAEFGKILIGDERAHGRSVGLNALKALMKLSKDRLGLDSLYLHVYRDNKAAARVYENAGFNVTDEHKCENGLWELVMEVLL